MRIIDAIRGLANPPVQERTPPPPTDSPDPLAVPLGEAETGPVEWRPAEGSGHLLIAGVPGSGKSMAMLAILTHICRHPGAWRVYCIDLKGIEFPGCERYPSVETVSLDPTAAGRVLEEVRREMERRRDSPGEDATARIAVIVDEVAEVLAAGPALREPLEAIVAQGPAVGVHMVLATQRPDLVDVAGMEHVERLSMGPRRLSRLRAEYRDAAGERELEVYRTEPPELDQAGPG